MAISGVGSSPNYQPQVQSYQKAQQSPEQPPQGVEKSQAAKSASAPKAPSKTEEIMNQSKQYNAAQAAGVQAANSVPGTKSAKVSSVDIYVGYVQNYIQATEFSVACNSLKRILKKINIKCKQ